jgi:hypothetical protein
MANWRFGDFTGFVTLRGGSRRRVDNDRVDNDNLEH